MDLPHRILGTPPITVYFPKPVEPPPAGPTIKSPHQLPADPTIDHPLQQLPLPPLGNPTVDPGHAVDPGPVAGGGAAVVPEIPHALVRPVHRGPELLTPPSQLKPPYPAAKLLSEEEATLNLRLSIDENGRVTAVDPIGRADGIFLEAARRYVLAHWRYRPATEDGRAVSSSITVTLRFMLDG